MLTDFPGKTGHFNIAERIGIKCRSIGTSLLNDVRGEVVPAIMSQHGRNPEETNMDILSRWVQGRGIADRTWRGLLGVLRLHCPGLAQDIEETLRAETDDSTSTPPQQESSFNKKLRDWYAESPLPYYFDPQCYKWMPNVSKKYIHPDIISKEEQEKKRDSQKEANLRGERWRITEKHSGTLEEDSSDTEGRDGGDTVELEELLEARSGTKCKCVLVEGGPGMGKSTLAWQVCHHWGIRELYSQYSTVLFLPLRDNEVQQAKQVEDLFLYLEDKQAREEMKREIGDGKDTLVILDGLDELPGQLLSKRSIFTDLLSGKVLSECTILVTSRPSATQQLLRCWKRRVSKHYIICGFNEGNIEEYTESILSGEQLTDFQKHLSIHPHIQAIMYVPLNSAIVMAVYLQYKQLPKTLTELYKALVETILSQYMDDNPELCGEEELLRAIDLDLPKSVHSHFIDLCKIAFDTLCRQKLMFTDKTMPKVLHDLGFTDSVPGLYMHKSCSYNFLHLSIQEFLAACYVSLLSPQEHEQLLLRSHREHHLRNMMKFVAGITKFEGIRKEAVNQVAELCGLDEYILELLYECQNVCILDNVGSTYSVCLWWYTPLHHCLALGYCIANSKCAWKLKLRSHLGAMEVQMLLQGLRDCTQPAYTIKHLEWNGYSDEVCGKLFTHAPIYFTTHIESMELKVIGNLSYFSRWLPSCRLKTLSLPELQPYNIEMVSRALTAHAVPSLKILNMKESTFTLHGLLTFVSMLVQNQSRVEVDTSSSNIVLTVGLHHGILDKKVTQVVTERSEYLASFFYLFLLCGFSYKVPRTLDAVSVALKEPFRAMLATLLLDLRPFGFNQHDSRDIERMPYKVIAINLHGEVRAIQLKLNFNTVLDISGMSLGERGALAVAEVLKYNTTLTNLDMSRNSVGEKGALAMAEVLKHNKTLRKLNISYNSVGERGALAMAETLKQHNTTLTVLDMSGNSVGERGALAMAEMLEHNTTLEKLVLCDYTIGVEGTKALIIRERGCELPP